jgi:hypothetical protein
LAINTKKKEQRAGRGTELERERAIVKREIKRDKRDQSV